MGGGLRGHRRVTRRNRRRCRGRTLPPSTRRRAFPPLQASRIADQTSVSRSVSASSPDCLRRDRRGRRPARRPPALRPLGILPVKHQDGHRLHLQRVDVACRAPPSMHPSPHPPRWARGGEEDRPLRPASSLRSTSTITSRNSPLPTRATGPGTAVSWLSTPFVMRPPGAGGEAALTLALGIHRFVMSERHRSSTAVRGRPPAAPAGDLPDRCPGTGPRRQKRGWAKHRPLPRPRPRRGGVAARQGARSSAPGAVAVPPGAHPRTGDLETRALDRILAAPAIRPAAPPARASRIAMSDEDA